MNDGTPLLGRFALRTLLWVPPSFAVWHLAAPHHAVLPGGLGRMLVNFLHPGMVSAVERAGAKLVFVTTIDMRVPGQSALLVPEIDPMVYTYGLALFLALMLATRAPWWKMLAGAALLLPFQAWGIAFDFLAQVGITLGPEVSARAGITGWRLEAIALGYQVGTLLMPAAVPVVLWAIFCREFIERLVRPATAEVPGP